MDKTLLNQLANQYAPLVNGIIVSNAKFYGFKKAIQWEFLCDDRVALFGLYNFKTEILSINLFSIDFAFQRNEPLHIENFLLHEMRHAFQYSEMAAFKKGETTRTNPEIIKKWIGETENYIAVLDKNGSMNPSYYQQSMEFDAYAFSYALMKYKYGEVAYISSPTQYGDEFNKAVENWCRTFQTEQL